jgi:hypothetical protein
MAVISIKNKTKSGSLLVGNAYYVPPSFESIATVNGTGSSTSLTFSSIPSTYTHLQIRGISRNTGGSLSYAIYLTFNGSSTGYSWHYLKGNGTVASASGAVSEVNINLQNAEAGGSSTANTVGGQIIDILDYGNTNKYKTVRALTGTDTNGGGAISLGSGLWQNTSAISSLTITNGYDFFSTSTTFALYGIKG